MFIGNKKIDSSLIGYSKLMDDKGNVYYRNDNVLPLGYATNNIISYEDYSKLNALAKQEVLLSNIVVDSNSRNEYVSYVEEIVLDRDNYIINVKDIKSIKYELDEKFINKIIYIEFVAKSNNCSSRIKINHVDKFISCKQEKYGYTISDKDIDHIEVILNKGKYSIKDIKVYVLDYARIENSLLDIDSLVTNNSRDYIEGSLLVSGDGYFIIKVLYDKGYNILMDGKSIKYEMVDNKYIGFPISKGNHNIKITNNIKDIFINGLFSYLGLFFMVIINYVEKKRRFT